MNINELRDYLVELTKQEYELNGYIPTPDNEPGLEGTAKVGGDNKGKSDRDIRDFHNKLRQQSNLLNMRRNTHDNQISITKLRMDQDSDIFNIVSSEVDTANQKGWKQLETEEQLTHLEEFFKVQNEIHLPNQGKTPYSEEIMEVIRRMINNSALYLKKDIIWDKTNQRISEIPLIKYQPASKTYMLKTNNSKKNIKKDSKNKVAKLFKK